MTFAAAVATGPESITDLRRRLQGRVAMGGVAWTEHCGQAVAWSATNSFVRSHDDGDVLVVLDGLLHNLFEEGRSQAELLLERYRKDGEHVARGLLGDFVAVVLDRARRSLLVCRDPLGVRPWYQATSGRRHSGASDQATLRRLPWVDDAVDEAEALGYLALASLSRGPTLHRGITTLGPGTTWRSHPGGVTVSRHFAWDIQPEPRVRWEDAIERGRAVLDDAVRSRLRAIGSSCSELSGGLDSSAVVGTGARLGHPPFVGRLVFDGARADERVYSQAVIDHWGIRAVSVPPWIPTEDDLGTLMADIDRPVPDANFTMFVGLYSALRGAGHAVSLTGMGGDDAFIDLGLENRVASAVQLRQWNRLQPLARAALRHPRRTWRTTVRPTLRHLSPRGRPEPPHYITSRASREHDLASSFTRPSRLTGVLAVDDRAENLTSGYTAFLLEARAILNDLSGHRNTHPFLDPRVVTALYGLDPWFPVDSGHVRALEVAAYQDRLPPVVRDRRSKAEFSEVFWPRMLTPEVLRRVTTGPLVQRNWLDLNGFRNVVDGAREGRPWAALPLSRAVELDRWLRRFES